MLGEELGKRRLPIIIGGFEAQAIAVELENMTPSRPLTHDLFKNALDTFGVDIQEVIISNLLDGVFYARLICLKDGVPYEIEPRLSERLLPPRLLPVLVPLVLVLSAVCSDSSSTTPAASRINS